MDMDYQIQERKESESASPKKNNWSTCLKGFYTSDSLVGAITNLANATIGVGILFLPSVIRETGFFVGFLLFMIGGLVESITLFLLYKSYDKLRRIDSSINDYEQIGRFCFGANNFFGTFMSYLIQLTIFILCLGGTISFSIIISDSLNFVRKSHPYYHALILGVILFVATVISMFPKIASLRFTSYLSMVVYFVFLILVIVSYFTKTTQSAGEYRYWPTNLLSVVSTMGIIIFSFSCHTILCPIVSQFEQKNQWKVGTFGVFGSIFLDYIFYCLIALFGYLCFVDNTQGDLILSFETFGKNRIISSTLSALMAISVFASYPLCIYIARYTINNLICDLFGDISSICQFCRKLENQIEFSEDQSGMEKILLDDDKNGGTKSGKEQESEKFCCKNGITDCLLTIFTSIIITTISYIFAIFYPKANVVFGLVGSTGAIFTVYIFPCLFYLRIYHDEMPNWFDYRRIGVILIGGLGTVFGIFVTIATVVKLINGD